MAFSTLLSFVAIAAGLVNAAPARNAVCSDGTVVSHATCCDFIPVGSIDQVVSLLTLISVYFQLAQDLTENLFLNECGEDGTYFIVPQSNSNIPTKICSTRKYSSELPYVPCLSLTYNILIWSRTSDDAIGFSQSMGRKACVLFAFSCSFWMLIISYPAAEVPTARCSSSQTSSPYLLLTMESLIL